MNHLYSPEYSNELLQFVKEVYTQDIAHYYPRLRLEKLIDLLEHAEYLFESYRRSLEAKQNSELLTAFVVGCFYIYLIIPHSIQFHSRDKSYAIYADLRKYYQDETNMTNVLLMVTGVIESVSRDELESAKIMRKRAYSVPHKKLSDKMQALTLSTETTSSTNAGPETDNENDSTMWTAPELEPNDHLKVNLGGHNSSVSSRSSNEQAFKVGNKGNSSSSDDIEMAVQSTTQDQRPRRSSVPIKVEAPQNSLQNTVDDIYSRKVDRYNTHRKGSYHSVHMTGDEYDSFTFNTARLQKQSIITCDKLLRILDSEEAERLLLVDLRFIKRFETNHIVAPNLVNLDPMNLWDFAKGRAIEGDAPLEVLNKNHALKDLSQFKHIVYYTDMKTFMRLDFDYQLVFFQMLYTSNWRISCTPKVLLGGYEQWKKFLAKVPQSRVPVKEAFLFRLKPGVKETVTSANIHQKASTPLPPSIPPPPPPVEKVSKADSGSYTRAPFPLPAKEMVIQSSLDSISRTQIPSHLESHYTHEKVLQNKMHHAEGTIPTIEQSSNEYVALSITGLRNMGNTCYINSMLQCLFATRKFRDLFLSPKYEDYFSKRYSNPHQLSKYFNILFKKMYMNGGCSVVPTGFLKACNALRPDLKIPHNQQDTQEFLLFLLSQLHDELSESNHVANDYPNLLLHDDESLAVDQKEYDKWFESNISENGISPIDAIFQGQMENGLLCQRCGHSSYNYSMFYVLSLAIPASMSSFGQKKKMRLEDCINLFTSDEKLTNENAWDCPKCGSAVSGNGPEGDKKKRKFLSTSDNSNGRSRSRFFKLRSKSRSRSVSPFHKSSSQSPASEKWKSKKLSTIKTLNFVSLPSVLTIHLSRFLYDLTNKNNKVITYPLTLSIFLKNNEVVNYRLYAIANHFGNLISGHYTSLVNKDLSHDLGNGRQKWYYFDDEVAKRDLNHGNIDAGITSVSSSDVYVLFYEKI